MIRWFKSLYAKAEKDIQSKIPWSVTSSGTFVVDIGEFVKRDVFWKSVAEFEAFDRELKDE